MLELGTSQDVQCRQQDISEDVQCRGFDMPNWNLGLLPDTTLTLSRGWTQLISSPSEPEPENCSTSIVHLTVLWRQNKTTSNTTSMLKTNPALDGAGVVAPPASPEAKYGRRDVLPNRLRSLLRKKNARRKLTRTQARRVRNR